VWQEVEGNLADLPGEQTDGTLVDTQGTDELAARRAARANVG